MPLLEAAKTHTRLPKVTIVSKLESWNLLPVVGAQMPILVLLYLADSSGEMRLRRVYAALSNRLCDRIS